MNSNSPVENTSANATNAANAVKAPKKPTLSAKYSRFLSFGHWFLTKTDLNEETRKQLYQQMMMFGSVEEQTVYFEGFFSDIKDTNKVMRKMVAEAKKPPKAPKAPRAKKTKAAPAAQDELVAQLIADANGSEVAAAPTEAATVAATVAAKEKKPRAKKVKEVTAADATEPATVAAKEKKPRAKKVKEVAAEPVADATLATVATEPVTVATEPVTVAATVAAAAPKEKKPRAKKADAAEKPKKTKKSEAAPAVDDASEDVQTRVVTIGDKEYLIDAENNLYDTTFPHDQVGTFHPETGAIQA